MLTTTIVKAPFYLSSMLLLFVSGCASGPTNSRAAFSDDPTCESRKTHLLDTLVQLPDTAAQVPVSLQLPTSTLGGLFGRGAILEVSASGATLDGEALPEEQLPQWLEQKLGHSPPKSDATVFVAAAPDTDVETLHRYISQLPQSVGVQLLFNAPPVPPSDLPPDVYDLAAQILTERDPSTRMRLTRAGYEAFSKCDSIPETAQATEALPPQARWPQLKSTIAGAIESCACEQLDTEGLTYLLVAEQRAGAVSLGSVPAGYLRDPRCSASMPLLSPSGLLAEVEKFDAEFSGDWRSGALHFDTNVLTNERLLNYLCVALPGETLEHVAKSTRAIYWKPTKEASCERLEFEPQSPRAPMGKLQRAAAEPLSLYYWLGAEEVRIFGPTVNPFRASEKPTTQCSQDFKLDEVREGYVTLEGGGRWFFSQEACEKSSSAESAFTGCISDLSQGVTPREPADTPPEAPQAGLGSSRAGRSLP